MRYGILFLAGFFLLASWGCAQRQPVITANAPSLEADQGQENEFDLLSDDFFSDDPSAHEPVYYDPLEPMNRVFFEFNDKLYFWVLKPVNTVYSAILPLDFRYCIGNFFTNLSAPVRMVNNLLQGKFSDAGIVLSRFLINSTLGVYGLGDPALVDFGLEAKPEDFGQTLGVWGVGEGVYLCWPIIGPSNARDSLGFAVDVYSHPVVYVNDDMMVSTAYYSENKINLLSLNPEAYEDLKKYSLDPYVSMRQVYLDYRRNKIRDKEVTQNVVDEL
ncbi:MAG: VacJ family lipoprotein [Proteobacteria bacterium]|nr:VacJ family lipoprotein [Pseudomonadota bacterium]MBU1056816.1 VacJ family lipoprotein [Pseudomonadota bacterium]